ncbi:MAG: hypothetical protein C6W55_12405 [Thermobacillus sp.]|nr:MAG: hypothetical protein C6W55_12405 [Thermobacillus sp.]
MTEVQYVNHNQWVDTFGVFHMDRAREKRVAGRIRRDYRYILGERSGLASPEPSVPRFRTLWESGDLPAALDGQGCWRLAWDSPVDASLYPFVQIDVEVHGDGAAFRVALQDAGQRAWSAETGKLPAGTRYPVYVPLWEAEGLDVRQLTSLAVQGDAGRKLFIRSVRLTLSGADRWTPLAE